MGTPGYENCSNLISERKKHESSLHGLTKRKVIKPRLQRLESIWWATIQTVKAHQAASRDSTQPAFPPSRGENEEQVLALKCFSSRKWRGCADWFNGLQLWSYWWEGSSRVWELGPCEDKRSLSLPRGKVDSAGDRPARRTTMHSRVLLWHYRIIQLWRMLHPTASLSPKLLEGTPELPVSRNKPQLQSSGHWSGLVPQPPVIPWPFFAFFALAQLGSIFCPWGFWGNIYSRARILKFYGYTTPSQGQRMFEKPISSKEN